jgi:hypothetical protein
VFAGLAASAAREKFVGTLSGTDPVRFRAAPREEASKIVYLEIQKPRNFGIRALMKSLVNSRAASVN